MQRFVDPKVLLANERTYIAWTKMSVTLGAISAGLLGGAADSASAQADASAEATPGTHVTWYIGAVLMPVALLFALHAAATYLYRNRKIRRVDYTDLATETMPLALGGVLVLSLTAVLLIDLFVGEVVKLK